MKMAAPFNALRNASSDIWKMHDFNYEFPNKQSKITGKQNV